MGKVTARAIVTALSWKSTVNSCKEYELSKDRKGEDMRDTINERLSFEPGRIAAFQILTYATSKVLVDIKEELYEDSPFFNLWLQCWASTKENVRRWI